MTTLLPRLERRNYTRAGSLLPMPYRVHEIAQHLRTPIERIRLYLDSGAPHTVDADRHAWIIGTDFKHWLDDLQAKHSGNDPSGSVWEDAPKQVNRRNWQDTRDYLTYREEVLQNATKTLKKARWQLDRILLWAGKVELSKAATIRPTLPAHLVSIRDQLTAGTQAAILAEAKLFFEWAMIHDLGRYGNVSQSWLKTLRAAPQPQRMKEHQFYTLEDLQAILSVEPETLAQRRDQASIALMFLSGARVGAFVTLPLEAVDLHRREMRQWPELGVKTKFGKAATTYLLDIPELFSVVTEWDAVLRESLPSGSMWYCNASWSGSVTPVSECNPNRRHIFGIGLRTLCEAAGIPYKSPHKLRHGHAVWAISHARNPADLKAISQNLMHENLSVTDGIYGILSDGDVKNRVQGLGSTAERADLEELMLLLAARLKE